DSRHNIPVLLKNGRSYVADLCAHTWRRDGPDVLALRGGDRSQAVAIIGFDGDLAAAFANRAGKGNYLNNVRSASASSQASSFSRSGTERSRPMVSCSSSRVAREAASVIDSLRLAARLFSVSRVARLTRIVVVLLMSSSALL